MVEILASITWTVVNWITAHPVGCIFWFFALFISVLFGRYAIKIWPEPQPWRLGAPKEEPGTVAMECQDAIPVLV